MKILHVSFGNVYTVPPQGYGGETFLYNILKGMAKLGIQADLAAPTGSHNPAGNLIDIGPTRPAVHDAGLADFATAQKTYFKIANNYDIIHSHQSMGIPYLLKVTYPDLPIVHTLHGVTTWEKCPPLIYTDGNHKEGTTLIVEKPNLITLGEWHRKHTQAILKYDSRICPPAIDFDEYPLVTNKEDYYLVLGKFVPENGHLRAIETALRDNVQLIVAGDSQNINPRYVRPIRTAAITAGFTFIENCDNTIKQKLISHAKGVFLPISRHRTGSGIALEALASGTEVYANMHTGIAELPVQNIAEFPKPPRSPQECRDSIAHMSPENVAKRLLELYDEAKNGGWS